MHTVVPGSVTMSPVPRSTIQDKIDRSEGTPSLHTIVGRQVGPAQNGNQMQRTWERAVFSVWLDS